MQVSVLVDRGQRLLRLKGPRDCVPVRHVLSGPVEAAVEQTEPRTSPVSILQFWKLLIGTRKNDGQTYPVRMTLLLLELNSN